MTVRKASLGKLTFLAEGRFGRVFRVGRFRLPGDPAALAYKEFAIDRAGQVTAAVALRDGLSPEDRDELDRFCAWPRALVADPSGGVCGFLMPLAPAAGIELAEAGHTERLVLLARVVYAIARLHRLGWVFGDLSFAKTVFALDPPRVLLLGCDGAAALADPDRRQSSVPGWDPPECPVEPAGLRRPDGREQTRQDTVTDAYKLGLAMLRGLVPGQPDRSDGSAGRLREVLDPVGADLVARALSADRGQRPAAKDLYRYLRQAVDCRLAISEAVSVSFGPLPRPHVPAAPALSLEPMAAAIAARPAVGIGAADRPAIPLPHALDLVEGLRPDRSASAALPRIDGPIAEASGAVMSTILSEGNRYAAALRQAVRGGGK